MTRAQRTQMARLLRGLFQQVEDERATMLCMPGALSQHERMALSLMVDASSKLEQAARFLEEPTPTHERRRK